MNRTNRNYFKITGANPPTHGQTYWVTFKMRIVATDIEDAITAAKMHNPGCKIYSAAHHGGIDIVTPSALANKPEPD